MTHPHPINSNEPPICSICGEKEAQPHFGGVSCRSCAAFFRRLAHSTKPILECTCRIRHERSHPCRHCRMLKCLAAGMSQEKVQVLRDKTSDSHVPWKRLPERLVMSCSPSSSSSSALSLSNYRIIPRDSPKICTAISNWPEFERKRKLFRDHGYETCFSYLWTSRNVYDISCYAKSDGHHLLDLFQGIFPQFGDLKLFDKDKLIANVIAKWVIMESCIDFSVNYDAWQSVDKQGHDKMIIDFFGSAIPEDKKLRDSEVIRIFGPYWYNFYEKTAPAIRRMNFDKFEYSALFLMLLFDPAYSNISEDCAKLCENARKLILRELKGYQVDQNFEESRFFDTVETLMVIDKAEEKFEEEMLICDMNNVKLDDYFKGLLRNSKF